MHFTDFVVMIKNKKNFKSNNKKYVLEVLDSLMVCDLGTMKRLHL
jgi:hypothetical protein